jgi:hypothetical protein
MFYKIKNDDYCHTKKGSQLPYIFIKPLIPNKRGCIFSS